MRLIKIFDEMHSLNLGTFTSSLNFFKDDEIVIGEKVYIVKKTLKYLYQDSEEVEHVVVTFTKET